MALDAYSAALIESVAPWERVLSLGWPDMPSGEDSERWFRCRGARVFDVVDLKQHRGVETIVNLNRHSLVTEYYDLVVNPGTLEHCFNIGHAWREAWGAVARGGHILHVFPATMFNHGYWNVSPIAVHDWCAANGGIVVAERFAVNGAGTPITPHRITVNASGRGALPEETVYYALCKRTSNEPNTWPIQGVYR